MIVDDDPGLLRLLRLRLIAAGYEVIPVESGEQALAQVLAYPPHLVITDLRMPGMDGLTLCEALHQCYPGLPVILLTAHDSPATAMAARQHGVCSVLPKPCDGPRLLTQVAHALSSNGPLHGYVAHAEPTPSPPAVVS